MGTHITIDQLERMKTHELADLLSNVVLLLRRMPNVECREFTSQSPTDDIPEGIRDHAKIASPSSEENQPSTDQRVVPGQSLGTDQSPSPTTWTVADLEGKKVQELKQIANDLHLPLPSKIKKDDLLNKLRVRLSRSHSEQYAIQDF
jgi:Rho termination factor, N-terminal domain